jgi:hypothetical protein
MKNKDKNIIIENEKMVMKHFILIKMMIIIILKSIIKKLLIEIMKI